MSLIIIDSCCVIGVLDRYCSLTVSSQILRQRHMPYHGCQYTYILCSFRQKYVITVSRSMLYYTCQQTDVVFQLLVDRCHTIFIKIISCRVIRVYKQKHFIHVLLKHQTYNRSSMFSFSYDFMPHPGLMVLFVCLLPLYGLVMFIVIINATHIILCYSQTHADLQ